MDATRSRGVIERLSRLSLLSSVKLRIIGGFALLSIILLAVAGSSAWQSRVHRSNLDDLESHSSIATLLQEAEAQAGIAALLVQRYVIAGDDTLIPEIQSHVTATVESLTEAVAQKGVSDVSDIAVTGATLAEGTGRVVALRRRGNVEGASAAMEEIVPVFRQFRLGLEDATARELEEVSDLRKSADRAGALAFWLLVGSGAGGAILGLAASILIARSIIRPLAALEQTASAVSEGDLGARAPATGPSELAHLGSVLNDMMEAVQTRDRELSDAYEELKERNRQITDARAQAATDALTGLGNHRSFHARIRDEIAAAESSKSSVSLIIFDIDSFKAINDSLGHLAGDEMLRQLAKTLRDVVPPEDAYRYGGDEFAVVLVGVDQKQATQAAERLRDTVEKATANSGQKLTVSLGVGSFPQLAASSEELIYRADMAMYWAKSTGKNRVGDWDGLLSRRAGKAMQEYSSGHRGKIHDAVASLVSALAAKDPLTRDHTERCSWYSAELAEELGLGGEETSVLRLASLLHDIGKLVMPDEVLCKPGPLNQDEWGVMRQHPVSAMHILSQMDSVAEALPAIFHHHERFDGSGYPDGLTREEIPLASRILMVTDAFDAMTSDRPYRKAMTIEAAVEELECNSGSQFDPKIVEAFVGMISRNGAHPLRSAAVQEPAAVGEPRELQGDR